MIGSCLSGVDGTLAIGVLGSLIATGVILGITLYSFHRQKNRELKQKYYMKYIEAAWNDAVAEVDMFSFNKEMNSFDDLSKKTRYYVKNKHRLVQAREAAKDKLAALAERRGSIKIIGSDEVRRAEEKYFSAVQEPLGLCIEQEMGKDVPLEVMQEVLRRGNEMQDELIEAMRRDLKLDVDEWVNPWKDRELS